MTEAYKLMFTCSLLFTVIITSVFSVWTFENILPSVEKSINFSGWFSFLPYSRSVSLSLYEKK